MPRQDSKLSRANHKTNKRMSIFRYSQIRSYKTVPNDFFVELKRYFVTQGFKIKRFSYTETSGQMVGRKDGWHLNFVPKFVLDIKQVNGVHFITFNYFARVRKIGIVSGIATQGITAIVGAATITGYLAAARNFVDAVGKAMDVLAGEPLSVEWLEKEEAGEPASTTQSQQVTYNTTNIQNVQAAEPSREAVSKETVVEHHHHYYYGAPNEHAHPAVHTEVVRETSSPVPAIEAPVIQPAEATQRLAIMPAEPSHPFYAQCDLEKELINMYERGDYDSAPSNPFYGGSEASAYDSNRDSSPTMFYGEASSVVQQSAPAVNPFQYEDEPVPQYNLPTQHAPLYSIEPMSYKQDSERNLRLEEIRQITPIPEPVQPAKNPFFDMRFPVSDAKAKNDDPFADLSLENIAGAYGMKKVDSVPVGYAGK